MSVQFIRQEILKKLPVYELIDDCLNQLVKEKGVKYLPVPNSVDPDSNARYTAYLMRAVFYDVTSRTLNGLVGQAYANDVEIALPELLAPIEKDANGKGITLVQSSKEAAEFVLSKGRCGLFVDYPKVKDVATRQQLLDGSVKPSINIYAPGNIINWDTIKIGSKTVLSLVVLLEVVQVRGEDGFTLEDQTQYRVLKLTDGKYTQEIHVPVKTTVNNAATKSRANSIKDSGGKGKGLEYGISSEGVISVVDSEGAPLTEIPFQFIGCVNNDPGVDAAPLYNLAELNIAHYRNSADFEESCFIVGQPTYVVSGLSADWLKNQLKGVINVGSRGGLPLPVGADAKILQPEANTMPQLAMEHKEKQMVAIGAKLVENDKVQQTATAANIENTSETSILATACKNVSAAYTFALQMCAKLTGSPDTDIKFEINTDFAINRMSAEEQTQLIASWQAGAITFSEMRESMRDSGIATLDDAEAKSELEADQAKKDKQAADAAGMLAKAVPALPVGNPKNTA